MLSVHLSQLLLFFLSGTIFAGLLKYLINSTHFLINLLSLELMILGLYSSLSLFSVYFNMDSKYMLYFLIMSVSAGVLGLSLLISCASSAGNDLLSNFSLLK